MPRAREALVCGHEAGRRGTGRAQGVKTWCELTLGCHPPGITGISCLSLLVAYLFSRLLASGWVTGPAFHTCRTVPFSPRVGPVGHQIGRFLRGAIGSFFTAVQLAVPSTAPGIGVLELFVEQMQHPANQRNVLKDPG